MSRLPHNPADRPGWRETAAVGAGLALTLIALISCLQLWDATPGVPFTSEGDAAFVQMTVQNIIDSGWYEQAPRLGAPFGATLHDFPQGGDNLQFALLRVLAVLSSDAGLIINAYFLLTFVLVTLAGLLVLRWIGVSRPVAVVLAVLYSFLPYHLFRGEHHLFLSGYYGVPLGIALAITAVKGNALFSRRPDRRGPAAYATRRTFSTVALVGLVGSSGSYYAAFTVVLLAAAGGLRALRGRSLEAALPAVVAAAGIVGVLGMNLLPSIAYRADHGANEQVAARNPAETERYGLKLSAMLLPDPGHRVAPLGALGARYRGTSDVPSEGGQALGIVGALGLLWLLTGAVVAVAGQDKLPGMVERHRPLSFLAVVTLLTGTVGGFSALVALFLTPQFRSWNRVSVVLGFLSLAAVGLLLDGWWAKRDAPRPGSGLAGLAVLLVVGLLDQTGGAVPSYGVNAARHESDAAFVAAIEDRLPRRAMVYQLPYVSFPESGAIRMTGPYDQVRGYLHSKELRWSFGGMRGRDQGWQDALMGQPVELLVRRLAAVGFAGVWIDRHGYTDDARSLEAELSTQLGSSPLASADGRLSFFSLVDFTAAARRSSSAAELAALAAQTLAPVQVRPADGAQQHREDGAVHWVDAAASSTLQILNPGHDRRTIAFDTRIEAAGPGTLTITWPDGSDEDILLAAGTTPLHRIAVVGPGAQEIRFSVDTSAFPARQAEPDVRFRLLQPAIYDHPPTDATHSSR